VCITSSFLIFNIGSTANHFPEQRKIWASLQRQFGRVLVLLVLVWCNVVWSVDEEPSKYKDNVSIHTNWVPKFTTAFYMNSHGFWVTMWVFLVISFLTYITLHLYIMWNNRNNETYVDYKYLYYTGTWEEHSLMCYKSLCQNCILLNTRCSFATLWQGDIPYIKWECKYSNRIGVPKIPMQLKFYCMTDFESDVQWRVVSMHKIIGPMFF
jgi:hypothetical protein